MAEFRPRVRTKNHSANDLRHTQAGLGSFPVRSVVRLGSITPTERVFPRSYGNRSIVEINTVEAVENSRSKLLMKNCFKEAEVPQSDWFQIRELGEGHAFYDKNNEVVLMDDLPYPILAKRIFGFKGHGMVKIENSQELDNFISNTNNLDGYYFEKFHNYAREYRVHCTQEGCFMVWRKLRRNDTPDDRRWFFNSENCNWVGEDNELFDKPSNWDSIVNDCVKAIKAVGLDIGSFDIRIQSSQNSDPRYILVEVNSAPSLGERGLEVYRETIKNIIQTKISSTDE